MCAPREWRTFHIKQDQFTNKLYKSTRTAVVIEEESIFLAECNSDEDILKLIYVEKHLYGDLKLITDNEIKVYYTTSKDALLLANPIACEVLLCALGCEDKNTAGHLCGPVVIMGPHDLDQSVVDLLVRCHKHLSQ